MEQTIINGKVYNDTILNAIPKSEMEFFCIQYYGNAGGLIVSAVTDITFNTKQVDTHNLWDGNSFVTPFATSYSISGAVSTSGANTLSIDLYINGVIEKRIGFYLSATTRIFSGDAYILSGKTVSIRPTFNNDTLANNTLHNINITAWINRRVLPQ
jgi:hypothetical protein